MSTETAGDASIELSNLLFPTIDEFAARHERKVAAAAIMTATILIAFSACRSIGGSSEQFMKAVVATVAVMEADL